MLWTIFVILLILWLLGLVSGYTIGGFIHILLVIAIVVVLITDHSRQEPALASGHIGTSKGTIERRTPMRYAIHSLILFVVVAALTAAGCAKKPRGIQLSEKTTASMQDVQQSLAAGIGPDRCDQCIVNTGHQYRRVVCPARRELKSPLKRMRQCKKDGPDGEDCEQADRSDDTLAEMLFRGMEQDRRDLYRIRRCRS